MKEKDIILQSVRPMKKILKQELEAKKKIKITLSVGETLNMESKDIVYKQLPKGRTKIFVEPLVRHTIDLSQHTSKLTRLIKKKFIQTILKYYHDHKHTMYKNAKFIAEIDFLVSGACIANKYYFCQPKIPSSDSKIPSYFKAKSLRMQSLKDYVLKLNLFRMILNLVMYHQMMVMMLEKNGILLYESMDVVNQLQ